MSSKTYNLIDKDKKYVWHPFTQQKNMLPPLPIVQAKNSVLIDDKGNEYIDAISSWWVTLHGHANPYIAKKIYDQATTLEQVIFAGFTHQPAVNLAERLIQILPNKSAKIFYSDNGSTAVEVALKMAIQFWWNKKSDTTKKAKCKILAFNNSYHGDTFGSMSVSDRSVFTLAFQNLFFEVVFIDTPNATNIHQLKKTVKQHAPELAAFIYEPLVQGAGGMHMYDAEAMNELLQCVQQQNIICIADEVMTGFGRTGKLFASEYIKTKPDIICLSKGLTGGTMALGATACTLKIYNAFVSSNKLKTFFHGHSFTANPLACASANASLDLLLTKKCQQKIEWISGQHKTYKKQLQQLTNGKQKAKPAIKNLRCLGTIIAFEMVQGNDEYLNTISVSITQKAMKQGVYLRPLGNTVYLMPPYSITKKELKKIYAVLSDIVEASK